MCTLTPVALPPGQLETRYKSCLDGIEAGNKQNRNGLRGSLRMQRRYEASACNDQSSPCGEPDRSASSGIRSYWPARKAILDREVLAFDVAAGLSPGPVEMRRDET